MDPEGRETVERPEVDPDTVEFALRTGVPAASERTVPPCDGCALRVTVAPRRVVDAVPSAILRAVATEPVRPLPSL